MLKRWFTLLLVALLPILGMAQNGTVYPIDLSVMMTPPYGTCLKEYVGSDRIVIQALLKDMSKTSEQFVIQLKVTDNRNRVVFQTWFGDYKFNPGQTFTYPMGPNSGASEKNILDDMFKNASVKLRNECFDEGAYTFTFQAFERASYPARKIALSMPFTYPVFLQGNIAQPLQIYPYDNDVICNHAYEYVLDAENNVKKFATQLNGIAYQWQSANPTGMRIGYHLQVVDLGDIEERTKGQIESAAQSAFRNGSFCPVNEIVYTPFYNHNITAGGYNENHAYAWRVRTVTGEELDKAPSYTKENMPSITDNNSPVRVFYFCGAPGIEKDTFKLLIDDRKFNKDLDKVEMDTVKTTGQSANAFWKDSDLKEKYCGVNVEIRKKGQEKWTPFFVEKSDETDAEGKAVDNSHNFENLSYNTRYEVRAQYVDCSGSSCQNRPEGCLYAPYSDVLEFMIPSPIDTAVCGDDLPKLTVCGEGTSVPKILSGDTIIANGAKVVVDEVSYPNASDSSIISGKGHLSMPIVKNIQLKMEFSEIQINCAKELVKGKVKSIWDEQTCAMINLDELTGQGSTGGKDNAPSEASTEEYSEEKAKNSPSGTLLVDEQGNVKFKLKDGNFENIGKSITLSSNEYQSKNYLAENSHYIEFYSTDKVNNAFDNDSAGWYRKMSHYDFFDAPNNKVILPWLANNPGKLKNIKAREVKKKETMASFDSVMFVIPSDAGFIQLKAEKEIVSRGGKNDTVYDLNIPGWADVNHSTPIFAIAKKSDTSSFFDAGKMMVANYAERTHKLNIVSLVGELDNSYKTEAEKALNSIYGKLGVTYEVNLSVFEDETIKDLLSDGLSIGADAESRWKSETSEMKAIRRIYAEKNAIDKKAAYLFVVNQPEEEEYKKSVEGDMPRSQSVGYIFKDNVKGGLGRLIAHEIGHGVYKFQHTFDYEGLTEGSTDNLMDYNSSDPVFLAQYQWRVMQDSVMFVWSVLQDDEDGLLYEGKPAYWLRISQQDIVDKLNKKFEAFGYSYEYINDSNYDILDKIHASSHVDIEFDVNKNVYNQSKISQKQLPQDLLFSNSIEQELNLDIYYKKGVKEISDYKIKSLDDLQSKQNVSVAYNVIDGWGYIYVLFFDNKGKNVNVVLRILGEINSSIDEFKVTVENWADCLLCENPKNILFAVERFFIDNTELSRFQRDKEYKLYKDLYDSKVITQNVQDEENCHEWIYLTNKTNSSKVELKLSKKVNFDQIDIKSDDQSLIISNKKLSEDGKTICFDMTLPLSDFNDCRFPAVCVINNNNNKIIKAYHLINCGNNVSKSIGFVRLKSTDLQDPCEGLSDLDEIEHYLDSVYNPIGISFTYELLPDDNVDYVNDLALSDDNICYQARNNTSNSIVYTTLNNKIQNIDNDIVIFIVYKRLKDANGKSVNGFKYTNSNIVLVNTCTSIISTPSHEVGHYFTLKDLIKEFPQQEERKKDKHNLMNYGRDRSFSFLRAYQVIQIKKSMLDQ